MKTSSYSGSKVKRNFEKFFDKTLVNRIGKVSGFVKRQPQKITAFAFVAAFIESCSKGIMSYSSWAGFVGNFSGKAVSKQALFDRMNEGAAALAEKLFKLAVSKKLRAVKDSRLFSIFNRVLLQDSTPLSLPQALCGYYPGSSNQTGQKAVARLQCIVNIVTMQWLHLSLEAFTDNDQSASPVILPILRKGDLLIRDLGYFVLDVLQQIIDRQAFFISRLRYGVTLYDNNGKAIGWKDAAGRQKGITDRQVWIGKKHRMRVRMIMIPLPAALAAERVRKARADRDKRLHHSPDYYQWLGYTVFITNVAADTLSAKQIAEVYKVRWQIEILFKSWKSSFGLQQVLFHGCTNIYRVKVSIYLLLLLMCLVMQKVYSKHYKSIKNKYGRQLSIIKLCSFINKNFAALLWLPSSKFKDQLAKHCCYERRKDRINMTDFIIQF